MNKQIYTVDTPWVVDGNLLGQFKALGYSALVWIPGRVRSLTPGLAKAAKLSGCPLAPPDEGMPEDIHHAPAPPVLIPSSEAIERHRRQYASEPKARVMCSMEHGWSNGTMREQFAALDRPPELGFGEIVKLPLSLLKLMENDGFEYTADEGEISQFEGQYQARYTSVREAWRKEQAERVQAEEARQEAGQRVRDVRASALAKLVKAAKLTPDELEALGL